MPQKSPEGASSWDGAQRTFTWGPEPGSLKTKLNSNPLGTPVVYKGPQQGLDFPEPHVAAQHQAPSVWLGGRVLMRLKLLWCASDMWRVLAGTRLP